MSTNNSDSAMTDLAALLAAGYEVKLALWPADMGGGVRADVTGAGTSSHGYGATPAEALRAVPVWPLEAEDPDDDVEPYCTSCGDKAGIFPDHGSDWRHYRGAGTVESPVELYDAGHAPVVGWREAGAR